MELAVKERPQSDLTHQGASDVFDLAEKEPVRIKRRGERPDEVLLSNESYESLVRFAQRLLLLSRAMSKGPEQMMDLEGLHWSKLLSVDERQQMIAELIEAGRAAMDRKDPSLFNAVWKGWARSAELMTDADAMAALTAPVDLRETIPLSRP